VSVWENSGIRSLLREIRGMRREGGAPMLPSMFSHLPASGSNSMDGRSRRRDALGSTAMHFGLVGALLWLGGFAKGELPAKDPDEQVTYIEVAELEERAQVEVEEDPPFAEEPEPEERELPSEVEEDSDLLAGFQELVAPDFVEGIPEPDLSRSRVSTLDFGGRGLAGGVARGRVTRLPSAETGSSGEEPPATRVFLPEAAPEAFVAPTIRLLGLLRWHPARRGTQAVPLLVEMPVNWVLPR